MGKDRRIVWVHPSKNTNCCPVHLADKYYMSLCPKVTGKSKPKVTGKSKPNFYVHTSGKTNAA